jgi:hypothetical protein
MVILYIALAYLIVGLIFSIPFLTKWIKDVDEASHNTYWSFKLAILPGCIVFWPILLKKSLGSKSGQL